MLGYFFKLRFSMIHGISMFVVGAAFQRQDYWACLIIFIVGALIDLIGFSLLRMGENKNGSTES